MGAFIYVPLLALTWAFGTVLAIQAAHVFMAIVESTAAGNKELQWPHESFIERYWKVFYIGLFVLIYAIPSMIISTTTSGLHPMLKALIICLPFWALFPLGMLSSMSLEARYIPFWPGLLDRMTRKLPQFIVFYIWSFPIVILMGYCLGMAWFDKESNTSSAIGHSIAGAILWMAYARLMGRIGLVLSFTKPPTNKKKKRSIRDDAPTFQGRNDIPLAKGTSAEDAPQYIQPTEMAPLPHPYEGEVSGYGVHFEDKAVSTQETEPVKKQRVWIEEDDDGQPIRMVEEEAVKSTKQAQPKIQNPELQRALKPPREEDVQMYSADRRVKEPKHPFGMEMFAFFTEGNTIINTVILCTGFAFMGVLIYALRVLRPL